MTIVCIVCHRPLKTAKARKDGMGKVCKKKAESKGKQGYIQTNLGFKKG